MRISVLQENLDKALAIVKPAIISRPVLPVLANVLLESDNHRLKLVTTDLEMAITVWVSAKVEQEGAITVPMKTLDALVGNLSPERVDLELNTRTQTLHMNCGTSKAQLKGIHADEFPEIKPVRGTSITMTGATLKDMIIEVVDSAAKVDNRPVLTGVYTHFNGTDVTMATADGYRLTVRKGVLDYAIESPLTLLIPARVLKEVAKLIGKGKKMVPYVVINTHNLKIDFDLGDVVVTTSLIEGTFPDYERIVPKAAELTAIVYRDELLRACKRAEVFAKDSSNTVRFSIEKPSDGYHIGSVHVSAQSSEMGEISGEIDASIYGNTSIDKMSVAMNVAYVIETLKAIPEDQVAIDTISAGDPATIRAIGRDDLYYIIMPMQVGK